MFEWTKNEKKKEKEKNSKKILVYWQDNNFKTA